MACPGFGEDFNSMLGRLLNGQNNMSNYYNQLQSQQGNVWATNTLTIPGSFRAGAGLANYFLTRDTSYSSRIGEAVERIKNVLKEDLSWKLT